MVFYIFSDAPRVQLALGKNIISTNIYEGGDVYFDCRVNSRPPPLRILWQQNVSNTITVCLE
jgi:hypothetical protein